MPNGGQAPIEVFMDVVAELNRMNPDRSEKLTAMDYASIADQVTDFLVNKESGLEQFYEIIRQGTVGR
jgi:hypothetical protein